MAQLENSQLLQTILLSAEKMMRDNGETRMSVDYLFCAVLECRNSFEYLSRFGNSAEYKELCSLIDQLISEKATYADFLNRIKGETYSINDSISYQLVRNAARSEAEKDASTEITSIYVLRSIVKTPSKNVKQVLKGAAPSRPEPVSPTPSTPAPQPTADQAPAAPVPETVPGDPKKKISQLVEETRQIREKLREVIVGQDYAINVFANGFFQSELRLITDPGNERPAATFLFAGPPGVGKTFLAETSEKVLGRPYKRFDMSEYSDNLSVKELIGTNGVYSGSSAGLLTKFVLDNPKCILLFDEIEKADIKVIHLFLQVLDAGRLFDEHMQREVSFKQAIIIFTTNAGRSLYDDAETTVLSGIPRKIILKALENDVDPSSGKSVFPAAICSRFSSGNVIMFNHIAAQDLRNIARREILKLADRVEKQVGIHFDIDERVFSSVLFAEGGAADARAVKGRAASFFNNELLELMRLVQSERASTDISAIENIRFSVEMSKDERISGLFVSREKPELLIFGYENIAAMCRDGLENCTVHFAGSEDEAKEIIHTHDIKGVLCEYSCGRYGDAPDYLNAEDYYSVGRDFFWFVHERYPELPVYILQTDEKYTEEEVVTFLGLGAFGVLPFENCSEAFKSKITEVCFYIQQQSSMLELAKSNKIITFETAQIISDDGKNAEIKLFDFEMITAVAAEDSQNILSNLSKPDVRFDDVIGAEGAKAELRQFTEFLKNPKKFMGTGLSAPKGVLLYGPPGTGKTMLAKAMAGESEVTFLSAEGNQFLQQYVGQGKNMVHNIFRTARKYAPAILFVDEIDAIGKKRTQDDRHFTADVLTAFLTNMDGFSTNEGKPVFVLAATNVDPEFLDPALMRRFDRRILVDLPEKEDRRKYLLKQMEKQPALRLSDNEVENVLVRSMGMSLAELASVIEMAMRDAMRNGKTVVDDEIFEEAFETFTGGESRKKDEAGMLSTARHEAGHALLSWLGGIAPAYITIVSRGDHGGYMLENHDENKGKYTRPELINRIRTTLAGKAAEIVYYGEDDGCSTGPSSDLASATNIAKHMICSYGMDPRLGLAVYDQSELQKGMPPEVRAAVNRLLSEQLDAAIEAIEANRPAMDALVDALIDKSHLSEKEVVDILSAYVPCGSLVMS